MSVVRCTEIQNFINILNPFCQQAKRVQFSPQPFVKFFIVAWGLVSSLSTMTGISFEIFSPSKLVKICASKKERYQLFFDEQRTSEGTERFQIFSKVEIKPCGLGSRIQYVEAFWYKTEIEIICFVPLCLIVLIVSNCMVKYQKLNIKNLGSG